MYYEIDIYDVDDVLINMRDALQLAMKRVFEKDIPWQTWNTYNLHSEIYDCSLNDFFKALVDGKAMEETKVSGNNKIYNMINPKRDNHIVSNRGWHPQAFYLTFSALFSYFPKMNNYHLLVPFISESKDQYIINNFIRPYKKRVMRVFEDSASTVLKLCEFYDQNKDMFHDDFHIVLVDRPWNQDVVHEKVIRIHSE